MIARLAMGMLVVLLLFGCVGPTGGNNSGQSGTQGDEVVVVQENHTGGMSDPSKCNNLPPQQMADCLEHAMGD